MNWKEYKEGITVLSKVEIQEIEDNANNITSEELLGFFDKEEDSGNFVLDSNQAREERGKEILKKNK